VDETVGPSLLRGSTVVVAHSLGTIVAYRLLRDANEKAKVPLFVTLGSPLGINAVKQHLRPPALNIPEGVTKWLNGTDERDYVALYARLDRDTFAEGIENVSDVHNRKSDAHAIVDYLSDSTICRRIHAALS
jgi:pimeloyl-ACP methyl ester carboxylesterase